jgi:hypothetical protein
MNATFASEFWHGASARALAEGLREAHWKVHEVDLSYPFLRASTPILRAAARLLSRESRRAFNREILESAATADGGTFLTVKGCYIAPETIRALKARGALTLLFFPDVGFDHRDLTFEVLQEVDLLFTTKSYHMPFLDRLRGVGRTRFIHHGYSPLAHRPVVDTVREPDYRWDIAYVGNPDAYKAKHLIAVAEAFPKLMMLVVGNGWHRFAAGTPLADRITSRAMTGDFMADVVQHSRINIAIHARPNNTRGWYDRVSTRTFEIPACRAFMLHEDNAEVRTLFEPEQEIGVFLTPEDLCDKIADYLARPARRAEMLARAYDRAVPNYSYYSRAAEIAAAVRECGKAQ